MIFSSIAADRQDEEEEIVQNRKKNYNKNPERRIFYFCHLISHAQPTLNKTRIALIKQKNDRGSCVLLD